MKLLCFFVVIMFEVFPIYSQTFPLSINGFILGSSKKEVLENAENILCDVDSIYYNINRRKQITDIWSFNNCSVDGLELYNSNTNRWDLVFFKNKCYSITWDFDEIDNEFDMLKAGLKIKYGNPKDFDSRDIDYGFDNCSGFKWKLHDTKTKHYYWIFLLKHFVNDKLIIHIEILDKSIEKQEEKWDEEDTKKQLKDKL